MGFLILRAQGEASSIPSHRALDFLLPSLRADSWPNRHWTTGKNVSTRRFLVASQETELCGSSRRRFRFGSDFWSSSCRSASPVCGWSRSEDPASCPSPGEKVKSRHLRD